MKPFVLRSLFCLFVLGVPLAHQALGQEVIPLSHCIRYDISTGVLDTYWGYAASSPVHIEVGENNFFTPGALFRNQPTDFAAGVHENVFVTSFRVAGPQTQINWFIAGRQATANIDSRPCDPPIGMGEWSPTVTYAQNVVVSFNGLLWVTPYKTDLTPIINKQPGANPEFGFWKLFTLTRVIQGDQGPKGDKGDRGDTGQPGQSVVSQAEPPGSNCTYGGVKYTDIGGFRYVCNGATGPAGPQGPPGNPNIFVASQIFTFSRGCTLTIADSRVTANSLILLQYVDGSSPPPVPTGIQAGRFTAVGIANRRFRYVVFQ